MQEIQAQATLEGAIDCHLVLVTAAGARHLVLVAAAAELQKAAC